MLHWWGFSPAHYQRERKRKLDQKKKKKKNPLNLLTVKLVKEKNKEQKTEDLNPGEHSEAA